MCRASSRKGGGRGQLVSGHKDADRGADGTAVQPGAQMLTVNPQWSPSQACEVCSSLH